MKLIDGDALLERCREAQKSNISECEYTNHFLSPGQEPSTEWWCVEDMIVDAPEVEGLVERHYARWYKPTGMMPPEFHGHYECSICGGWALYDWRKHNDVILTEFCPYCGAKMWGGPDEGRQG